MEQLWADVEYTWGTSFHNGDVGNFLRIKTLQWSRGEVLEEHVPLIGDMDSYFTKWREWKISDLGKKSSTSIKGAEKEEAKDIQSTNQPINQSINNSDSMSIFNKSYLFNKLSTNSNFSTSFQ